VKVRRVLVLDPAYSILCFALPASALLPEGRAIFCGTTVRNLSQVLSGFR
jgi:hypothetical protein